jgi:hypothetical protein
MVSFFVFYRCFDFKCEYLNIYEWDKCNAKLLILTTRIVLFTFNCLQSTVTTVIWDAIVIHMHQQLYNCYCHSLATWYSYSRTVHTHILFQITVEDELVFYPNKGITPTSTHAARGNDRCLMNFNFEINVNKILLLFLLHALRQKDKGIRF